LVAPVADRQRKGVGTALAAAAGIDKLKVERSSIPAVAHVDYFAGLPTLDAARNPLYHRLIRAFHERTGCPVVINTSFNLGWDPIVYTPQEALETFMSSDIDALCLGKFILIKQEQPAWAAEAPVTGCDAVLGDLIASPCDAAADLTPAEGA